MNKPKEIAVYKGDKFIAIGTYRQVAKIMNISLNNLHSSISHSKNRKYEDRYIVVELGEIEK